MTRPLLCLPTAWMWAEGTELRGLAVCGAAPSTAVPALHWQQSLGCACGDETLIQTVADFWQHGPPPVMGDVPADIATQLHALLRQMGV